TRSVFVLALLCNWTISAASANAQATDGLLFDFEDPAELEGWTNLELPDAKVKEPAAKIERSAEHATSAKHSLKITSAGGNWPPIIPRNVPDDWMPWHTFRADVTVNRPCVVGFCVMQEGSTRAAGWDGGVSRWAKTAFLKPGKNSITAELHPNGWSAI